MVTTEQKLLAIAAHIAWVVGGIGLIVVPLIVYVVRKNDPFVAHHAKQALVAQLTMFVMSSLVSLLMMILIGFLLLPALALLWIGFFVAAVMAVVRAADSRLFYYPFIQPFVDRL